jgi:hypothetical protein
LIARARSLPTTITLHLSLVRSEFDGVTTDVERVSGRPAKSLSDALATALA